MGTADRTTGKGVGPLNARRSLGRQLRAHREAARKTANDFVTAEIGSEAKMYRIESGKSPVRVLDVREMCRIYQVDDATRAKLEQLAVATHGSAWWEPYGEIVPAWFQTYVDLEANASQILTYELGFIPGLLQTQAYHEALITANPAIGPETARRTIAFRAARQASALHGERPLNIQAVLDEAVITRVVGSDRTMGEQREHLLKVDRHDHVELSILPFSAGAHAGMKGSFTVLVPQDQDPDVVFVETRAGGWYIEEEATLLAYRADFDSLLSQSIPIKEYLA